MYAWDYIQKTFVRLFAKKNRLLVSLGDEFETGTTNPRIRVDVAQTSFFEGREFRTFREWPTATTGAYIIKVVAPVNVIMFEFNIAAEEGSARVASVLGGTEGGSFSETLPIRRTNAMTDIPQPPYTPQILLTAGGTLAGGTELDVMRVKTSGVSNFAASVGSGLAERGIAPATYYFKFAFTSFVGVLHARWEERP